MNSVYIITILFLWWYDQLLFQRVGSPSDVLSVNSDRITSIEVYKEFHSISYWLSTLYSDHLYLIQNILTTSHLLKILDNKPSFEFSLIHLDPYTLCMKQKCYNKYCCTNELPSLHLYEILKTLHWQITYIQEDPCVDSFLHNHKWKFGWVFSKTSEACPQLINFIIRYSVQLAITYTITEYKDLVWKCVVHLEKAWTVDLFMLFLIIWTVQEQQYTGKAYKMNIQYFWDIS